MRTTILPATTRTHPTVVVTDPITGKQNSLPCLTAERARKVAQLAQDSSHYAEFQERLMNEFKDSSRADR